MSIGVDVENLLKLSKLMGSFANIRQVHCH